MSEIKCPECENKLKLIYVGYDNGVTELFHCEKCLKDWQRTFASNKGFSELERKFGDKIRILRGDIYDNKTISVS